MIEDENAARCDAWLAAWTGNRIDRLLGWYADDCAYADPSCPAGLFGRQALQLHLRPLLGRFPDWQFRRRLLWRGEWSTDVFWRLRFPAHAGMDRDGLSRLVWRDRLILQQESSFDLAGLGLEAETQGVEGRHRHPRWQPTATLPGDDDE